MVLCVNIWGHAREQHKTAAAREDSRAVRKQVRRWWRRHRWRAGRGREWEDGRVGGRGMQGQGVVQAFQTQVLLMLGAVVQLSEATVSSVLHAGHSVLR
jgi:hypothetical protein